ncbi:relaxase/mobilization nuclease domain-containing protein (plasmid) [Phocaeicola dorei]|nr:relaxase/mobilization nuclease domain-containing protein [Phocaeicola dorei]
MTDADWAKLGNDFMQRMGLMNHQYIIVRHSGTERRTAGKPTCIYWQTVCRYRENSTKTTG